MSLIQSHILKFEMRQKYRKCVLVKFVLGFRFPYIYNDYGIFDDSCTSLEIFHYHDYSRAAVCREADQFTDFTGCPNKMRTPFDK